MKYKVRYSDNIFAESGIIANFLWTIQNDYWQTPKNIIKYQLEVTWWKF